MRTNLENNGGSKATEILTESGERGKEKKIKLTWKLKATLDFIFWFKTESRNIFWSFIIMSENFPPKVIKSIFLLDLLAQVASQVWEMSSNLLAHITGIGEK